jgi:hypothetical protein
MARNSLDGAVPSDKVINRSAGKQNPTSSNRGESVRATPVMAAAFAATLLWGGPPACAAMASSNSGWFYTTPGGDEEGLSAAPDLPLGIDAESAPSAFGSTSLFGPVRLVDRLTPNVAFEFGYDADFGAPSAFAGDDANTTGSGLFSFASILNSPYAALDDREMYVSTTIGVGDGLSFSLGDSMLNPGQGAFAAPLLYPAQSSTGLAYDPREANTVLAGANWKFAPWGGIGLVAAHSVERNDFLAAGPAGGLSIAKSASASGLGLSGRIGLGSGWITTFSYNEAVTQLDLRPGGNALASVELHSRSYGLSIAKHGLFGDDSIGLAVSRPLELASSSIDLGQAAIADPFDGLMAEATRPILSGEAQQTDLELGYVTTFMDGVTLQANAGYQMNVAGQSGNNGVAVLSRAKINF